MQVNVTVPVAVILVVAVVVPDGPCVVDYTNIVAKISINIKRTYEVLSLSIIVEFHTQEPKTAWNAKVAIHISSLGSKCTPELPYNFRYIF